MGKLVCEICNGSLLKEDGAFVCQNCGTKYSVEEVKKLMANSDGIAPASVDNSSVVDNYMLLATNAYESKNQSQAELYCNKVIEVDPSNYKAWFLKAKAAGWQSTLANPRFSECISCFTNALNNTPENEKADLAEEAKEEVSSLALALIALRAERFEKWPDKEEAGGFNTDLLTILNAVSQFVIQAGVIVDIKELNSIIARKINDAVTNAWKNTIIPDYNGDENRPNQYEWKRYIERVGHCTTLLERAVSISGAQDQGNITRYENLIYIHQHAIDSCSWDYNFVGSTKSWHKDWSLTDEAKNVRRNLISSYRNQIDSLKAAAKKEKAKELEEDYEGKDIKDVVAEGIRYLGANNTTDADIIFDYVIKKAPKERVGYIGKAVATYMSDESVPYSDIFRHVLKAATLTCSDEYATQTKRLINYKMGEYGLTLLMCACDSFSIDAFKALIEMGADVNIVSDFDTTALWYICFKSIDESDIANARQMARTLLNMGASANISNRNGVALFNNKTDYEIAKMIKEKYPEIQRGDAPSSPKASSGCCYVATAVYGSYDCPEVWTLRRYRDDTLAKTWYGRAFVKTYYAISPTIVKWFGKTKWFNKLWKSTLDRKVKKLNKKGVGSTPYNDIVW